MNIFLRDAYWSVQGEGYNTGRWGLFLKFHGCNLKCEWCDTDHKRAEYKYNAEQLVGLFNVNDSRYSFLTGGEPSVSVHVGDVINLLRMNDFIVCLESNGVEKCPQGVDFLTVSPKRDNRYKIHPYNLVHANEFKYVVDQNFEWEVLSRHKGASGQLLYLSPEYTDMESNVIDILSFIETRPEWRLSLQTQKWIDVR